MSITILDKILTHWGFSDAKITRYFHPDSPRIVAKISAENRHYILKGIAPQIFPTKCGHQEYYLKKDGYWFYLIEFIDGRPMQEMSEDELLLGKLARMLHSLEGYSFPSALNENKQRFYSWFSEKPFKAAFDMLLDSLPDFENHDRCLIHTDLGPHNTMVRTNGEAVLIDLDDAGIGSRYLDLGWPFIMQFVEHTEDMQLSYRFDLAQAFLQGYYGTAQISEKEYDLLWHGAAYMHISYMQSYGPDAVDSLWQILQFGLEQKSELWEMIQNT